MSNSRTERKLAEKRFNDLVNDYESRFLALLHNTVEFDGLGDTPKRYILNVLIEYGAIAYDRQTNLYLRKVDVGIDTYGLPTGYQLYGYNGLTLMRKPDDVVILRVNDLSTPLLPYIHEQSIKLAEFDTAIMQNLEAIRTMSLVECSDNETMLSMVNMQESRRVGATVCYVNKSANLGQVTAVNTGAQYLIDKLQVARANILAETCSRLGIEYTNSEKKERVQGMEIESNIVFAMENISTLIDTFNYDAEQGGLSIRLKNNTKTQNLFNKGMNDDREDKNNSEKDKNNSDEDTTPLQGE